MFVFICYRDCTIAEWQSSQSVWDDDSWQQTLPVRATKNDLSNIDDKQNDGEGWLCHKEGDTTSATGELLYLSNRTCPCSSPSHRSSWESLATVFQAMIAETSISLQKGNKGKEQYTAALQKQTYCRRYYMVLNKQKRKIRENKILKVN